MVNEIGIKINNQILLEISSNKLRQIQKVGFKYIEYQSPIFNINIFSNITGVNKLNLKPHSVFLSIAKRDGVSKYTISRINNEIISTKSKYLGEHIGSISRKGSFPTNFYLYPPTLTESAIKIITANYKKIYSFVKVPIALENPVFYTYNNGDKLDYLTFIKKLDKKLPKTAGWLIDISHLVATCINLNLDIISIINYFRSSKRKIYEIHISSLIISSEGIADDNHNVISEDANLIFNIRLAKILARSYTSLTLESSNLNINNLKKIYSLLINTDPTDESVLINFSTFQNLFLKWRVKNKVQKKTHELSGRTKIITKSIKQIIGSNIHDKFLITYFEFKDFHDLAQKYMNFTLDKTLTDQIDYSDTHLGLIFFFSKNIKRKLLKTKRNNSRIFNFIEGLAKKHALICSLRNKETVDICFKFYLKSEEYYTFNISVDSLHVKVTHIKETKRKLFKTGHTYDIYL